jgi:hypothetical protein
MQETTEQQQQQQQRVSCEWNAVGCANKAIITGSNSNNSSSLKAP